MRSGFPGWTSQPVVPWLLCLECCPQRHLAGELQHASYIASWLDALRNDKRLIFTTASQAQKAADFLIGPLVEQAEEAQVSA